MANQPDSIAPFLDRLERSSAQAVLARGFPRAYRVRQLVTSEGERSQEVVLIRRGWVDIVKGNVDGREMVIAQRGEGEIIGELSAIDGLPRTATVRAATDVEATVVASGDFLELIDQVPGLSRAIMTHLAARVRQASGGLLELGVADGTSRVCGHLVALLDRNSVGLDNTCESTSVYIGSQERLGQVVGLHRSTLVKILSELKGLGVIGTGRGIITILDAQGLRKLASDPPTG